MADWRPEFSGEMCDDGARRREGDRRYAAEQALKEAARQQQREAEKAAQLAAGQLPACMGGPSTQQDAPTGPAFCWDCGEDYNAAGHCACG